MCDPAIGGGCAHHFCKPCLESWQKTKPNCPICRAPIITITLDYEFANALGLKIRHEPPPSSQGHGRSPLALTSVESAPVAVRSVRVAHPAGITVTQRGQSCVITVVQSGNGAARANLKVGDLILAVNGVRVAHHAAVIDLIESQSRNGFCELTVERPRRIFPSFTRLLSISS